MAFALGRMHQLGHATELDHRKALRYFEKALDLDPEFKGAWLNIGHIHEHGNRKPADREKAAYFFELAHPSGSLTAARKAGDYFEGATDGGLPDYLTAAKFYKMASELENTDSKIFFELADLANKPEVIEHFGKEETLRWKARRKEITQETKDQAAKDLAQAKAAYDEGHVDEAANILMAGFDFWSERHEKYWNWQYMGAIWWDAQTERGRTDLEWARLLYSWLADEILARDDAFRNRPTLSHQCTRIGVRTNLCGRLLSLGHYGLLRARTAEIKHHIRIASAATAAPITIY